MQRVLSPLRAPHSYTTECTTPYWQDSAQCRGREGVMKPKRPWRNMEQAVRERESIHTKNKHGCAFSASLRFYLMELQSCGPNTHLSVFKQSIYTKRTLLSSGDFLGESVFRLQIKYKHKETEMQRSLPYQLCMTLAIIVDGQSDLFSSWPSIQTTCILSTYKVIRIQDRLI